MPTVTSAVSGRSALTWAGFVPLPVLCGAVRSAIVAPLQLTSSVRLALSFRCWASSAG
jgi:hypothetical protein